MGLCFLNMRLTYTNHKPHYAMKDYILIEMIKDACKAFIFGGLLIGMWVCFTACTTASETARLDAAIRAGEFAHCETDWDIVDRARAIGLDIDALHAENVIPF